MHRTCVQSTNVRSIGYSNGIIEVEFKDGSIYHYYGASEALFNQFLNSSSKGQFVHRVLNRYRFSRG